MILALLMPLFAAPAVRADVGIILNESLDTSVARITGSGHSAVYLSSICPESPVKLRLCRPGEQGSVMSNYTTLGEDQPFEWNIVPLSVFVYGVANPEDRPLFSSAKIKRALEERYRETILRDYCASHSCQTSGKAEWREMVSATSERSLYILIVSATRQQDLDLIAKFNSMPNVNHFNGATRNCADFTRNLVDTYFPHAAHRDVLNDFGMTSPKAVARSFAHYAHDHPDDQYRVIHFAQLPGTIKYSTECRSGTEQLYHSKKLLVPMAIFAWHELPVVAGSYLLTGRFNPEHEFEQHATIQESEISYQLKAADQDDDPARIAELKQAAERERSSAVGSPAEWSAYHEAFDSMVIDAVREGIIPEGESPSHSFKSIAEKGEPLLDGDGLWMKVQENGKTSKVGLNSRNLLAPESDPRVAYQMMLAHVDDVLKSPAHRRETMPEFKEAWNLLQRARTETNTPLAMKRAPAPFGN
jgi:hypothetical protein